MTQIGTFLKTVKNEGTTLSMSVPLLLKERVGKMES